MKCYPVLQRESLPLDDPSSEEYRATCENAVIGPGRLGPTSPSTAPKTRIAKSEVSPKTNKDKLLKAIYLLKDIDGSVRYVGYTIDPSDRLRRHKSECRSGNRTHRKMWIAKMLDDGHDIDMEVVEWTSDWNMAERQWIFKMRALGCDLVNGSNGGDEMPPGCRSGSTVTRYPEVKRAYRIMEMNIKNWYGSEINQKKLKLYYEYYRDCLVPCCRKNKLMPWLESNIEKYSWKFAAHILHKFLNENSFQLEELLD